MKTKSVLASQEEALVFDSRSLRWLFVAASFLGSSLLFLVQPMVARLLLPIAGGSSALWNSAMVFFQLSLLGAYLFAHLASTRLRPRVHGIVQMALFLLPLLLVLPVRVPDGWVLESSVNVSLWTLGTLLVIVGLPFFAISTASPTLQRWYSLTGQTDSADPYFLYAAGNIGSVLALVAYPLAVEPLLTLRQQGWLWTVMYGLFVLLAGAAAATVRSRSGAGPAVGEASVEEPETAGAADRTLWMQRATWVAWAAVPSALLLAVTSYITTDLASFPLLWVIPLLGYLLSFVAAFGGNPEKWVTRGKPVVLFGLIPLTISIYFGGLFLLPSVFVQLIWFVAAALVCHGRLAADRPPVKRLTEFYLAVSIGGAIGGLLTVLLAPAIFPTVMEYPIIIALVILIVPLAHSRSRFSSPSLPQGAVACSLLAAGAAAFFAPSIFMVAVLAATAIAVTKLTTQQALSIAVGGLLLFPSVIGRADSIHSERTPFGVYGVADRDGFRTLTVGTTTHGSQDLATRDAPQPTSYYHPEGPLGQIFVGRPDNASIGVVGLGAGTVAAYGQPGDHVRFFEIDPAIVEIAENEMLFTYLTRSEATLSVEVVDGRQGVARSSEQFDVLVLDAFSSDAIPVHLLTVEALRSYVDHLNPDGLLAFHISNRHFDLEPVLGRLADELDVVSAVRLYEPEAEDRLTGATTSQWLVMALSPEALEPVTSAANGWTPARASAGLWTDDYSFVLGALDF